VETPVGQDGVSGELLAAMANAGGGAILVGIGAGPDDGGAVDQVIGCATDRAARQHITSAAADCRPEVPIAVFVENTVRTPILRVEVDTEGLHAAPGGVYPVWTGEAIAPLSPAELTLRTQEGGLAMILRQQQRSIAALRVEVTALRGQVETTRNVVSVTATRIAAVEEHTTAASGKLVSIEETAKEAVSRVRALARHLGAEDRLRAWERRQLRTVMATVLDVAQRRGSKAVDQQDVMNQVKKTWSKVYDWVNDEVVDQLQKEAQELIARTPPGDERDDDDEV
jgi:hypothetical protein